MSKQASVIITDNCWGADYYKERKIPYNSPFIGLFIPGPAYLLMLQDFDAALATPLRFIKQSRYRDESPHYPIAELLDGIEIHFLHYKSEKEATEKWARRCARLQQALTNNATLLLKMCDGSGATDDEIMEFHQLPFVKQHHNISFSQIKLNHPNNIQSKRKGHQLNGIKLFRRKHFYFDFKHWESTGEVRPSLWSWLKPLSQKI